MAFQLRGVATFVFVAWSLKDPLVFTGRLATMGYALARPQAKAEGRFCGLCDDFVSDLFIQDEVDEISPCGVICLWREGCMEMCGELKAALQAGTHFPCVTAGYCPEEADELRPCKLTAAFGCEPRAQCQRAFHNFQVKCELRRGFKQWHLAQRIVRDSAAALGNILSKQPY